MSSTQPCKWSLLLTHLYNSQLHECPELELHYMLINKYDIDTLRAINTEDYDETVINDCLNINECIHWYRSNYYNVRKHTHINSSISNIHHIIKQPNYIQPELGYVIQLENGHNVVIKTTCWLKMFQKKIRNTKKIQHK